MSESFTPGPWQVHSDEPEYSDYIIGDIDGPIEDNEMTYSPVCCVSETKHFAANRRLIAAAPELLAQLQHAVRWHDQLNSVDIERMRGVIAKAEGKS